MPAPRGRQITSFGSFLGASIGAALPVSPVVPDIVRGVVYMRTSLVGNIYTRTSTVGSMTMRESQDGVMYTRTSNLEEQEL